MHYLQHDWTGRIPGLDIFFRPADGWPDIWQVVVEHEPLFAKSGMRRLAGTLAWTPLHAAAISSNVILIRELINTHKCDFLRPCASSWTPLHYAAALNKVGSEGRTS